MIPGLVHQAVGREFLRHRQFGLRIQRRGLGPFAGGGEAGDRSGFGGQGGVGLRGGDGRIVGFLGLGGGGGLLVVGRPPVARCAAAPRNSGRSPVKLTLP